VPRPELEQLPARLARLPVSKNGYPVPWFVAHVPGPDGEMVPDFRVVDTPKLGEAIAMRRCWVCGEPLGRWMSFPIGPMCAVNRVTSEPPCHRDCAGWSVRNCPFLSTPRMVRRDEGLPEHVDAAGTPILRNPGVVCLWATRSYQPFRVGDGVLIRIGEPEEVSWWREGRPATRDEVEDSVATGLPILLDMARSEGPAALDALNRLYERARQLFPVAS
jgi:hypothetical protein